MFCVKVTADIQEDKWNILVDTIQYALYHAMKFDTIIWIFLKFKINCFFIEYLHTLNFQVPTYMMERWMICMQNFGFTNV